MTQAIKTRKAQITLFILIGIVVLLAGSLLFYLAFVAQQPQNDEIMLQKRAESVQNYISSCIDSAAKNAFDLMKAQGFYLAEPPEHIMLGERKIALLYKEGTSHLLTIEQMEASLNSFFVDPNTGIPSCVKREQLDKLAPIKQIGSLKVTSAIQNNSISISVEYPITLSYRKSELTTSSHQKTYQTKIGQMRAIVSDALDIISFYEGNKDATLAAQIAALGGCSATASFQFLSDPLLQYLIPKNRVAVLQYPPQEGNVLLWSIDDNSEQASALYFATMHKRITP